MFKWSRGQVQAAFISYAALNGLTLSVIFLIYTAGSIALHVLHGVPDVWRDERVRLLHQS